MEQKQVPAELFREGLTETRNEKEKKPRGGDEREKALRKNWKWNRSQLKKSMKSRKTTSNRSVKIGKVKKGKKEKTEELNQKSETRSTL